MQRIFISYRRGADSDAAARLKSALEDMLPEAEIFLDVADTPSMAGRPFREILRQRIVEADAFLALIGPGWLADKTRLSQQDDMVAMEIEAALAKPRFRVVPVLVNGARMPKGKELPDRIGILSQRGAMRLEHEAYDGTVRTLAETLGLRVGTATGLRRYLPALIGTGALVGVIAAGVTFINTFGTGTVYDPPAECHPGIFATGGSLKPLNTIAQIDTFTPRLRAGGNLNLRMVLRSGVDRARLSCVQFLVCAPETENFCKTYRTFYQPIAGETNSYSLHLGPDIPEGPHRLHVKFIQAGHPDQLTPNAEGTFSLSDYQLFGESRDFDVIR